MSLFRSINQRMAAKPVSEVGDEPTSTNEPEVVVVDPETTEEPVVGGEVSVVDQPTVETYQPADVPPAPVARKNHVSLEEHFIQSNKVSSATASLRSTAADLNLVRKFAQIAQQHSLSEPVVATMRAVPGFVAAATRFPDASLYDVVPAHKSSARFAVALESFGEAEGEANGSMKASAKTVVDRFDRSLMNLKDRAQLLGLKIKEAKEDLEKSDVSDEVLAIVPVTTLSNEAFDKTLRMLEKYLTEIDAFKTDDFRTNPEKMKEEIDGLVDLVGDLGRILGVGLDDNGLFSTEKGEEFEPKTASFEQHELTKSGLTFFIDKATSLLDLLEDLGDKKDYFVDALREESENFPDANDDEDAYDTQSHVCMICSYVTLVTTLVDETVIVVSRLISVVDHAISGGVAEAAE